MEYSKEKAQNDTEYPSVRTAQILQKIGNTIENDIKLTYDTPQLNNGGCMPVLDLHVWEEDNVIRHVFFKKDVSNEYTVMK